MITGRRDRMNTLRQPHGPQWFSVPSKLSRPFCGRHAGTAISQALGLAVARDLKKREEKVVAVVGDGAMTAGLSYEAMNNAGHLKKNMLIGPERQRDVPSPGRRGMSRYLNRSLQSALQRIRARSKNSSSVFRAFKGYQTLPSRA